MYEVPFKTLKNHAKRALDKRIARCHPSHRAIGFDAETTVRMLIPCALLEDDARMALKALGRDSKRHPSCGLRAKRQAQTHAHADQSGFSAWLTHARRCVHHLIDGWGGRCVASLIAHFPECVAMRQQDATISCHLDDGSGEWIVVFAGARPAKEERP